jgi:hypothetical protein
LPARVDLAEWKGDRKRFERLRESRDANGSESTSASVGQGDRRGWDLDVRSHV